MSNIVLSVQQGSLLGFVRFLLYSDDMRNPLLKCFGHVADDTTVFASDSDINNVHATVNNGLVGVDNWLKANRL